MARILEARERFPEVEWLRCPAPEDHPHYHYPGFFPDTKQILLQGHVKAEGRRSFGVETVWLRDTAIVVRDGSTLRADIFHPQGDRVPAILPWSPYGKTGTGPQQYDVMGPYRCGVEPSRTSGYEKFEAPDPAEWAERGYAVVNIDARGVGDSEGDVVFWGQQEAEDIYDVINWLSQQSWCNGSILMAGNSWLAISQINFASRLQHPALKAIAPWECLNDPYRHFCMRGGRPNIPKFHAMLLGGFAGRGSVENLPGAFEKHPLYDDFWESKKIHIENIDIPVYQLASYSSQLHTRGSFEVMELAKTTKKWLRVHPYQEWYDLYRPAMNDDLQRFFDYYGKGLQNGWESDTPRFRLSLLAFEGSSVSTVNERPYTSYPVANTQYIKYYLAGTEQILTRELPEVANTVQYDSHHLTASSDFKLVFSERTEVHGLSKVKLWMSCPDHEDMDVCVQIRKVDVNGCPMQHLNYPCPVRASNVDNYNIAKTLGPEGCLRASHRNTLDVEKSSEIDKVYRHDSSELIKPGVIVPLEITLWPMGMVFAAGEGLLLRISGHTMALPECPPAILTEPVDDNRGLHILHCGGAFDSHLIIPLLPEYRAQR